MPSNVDKESKVTDTLWILKLMSRLVFGFHEILDFFPQRNYALQHFAVTQPSNFRIIYQIT
jgi:hypothetical protein